MDRTEFLAELKEKMLVEGADSLVQENLSYYDRYITEQCEGGKTEQQVLEELGSPSLIARSILEAAGYEVDGIPDRNPGEQAGWSQSEDPFRMYETGGEGGSRRTYSEQKPVGMRTAVLVLLLVLLFLILLLAGLFWLLSPILIPVLIVALIVRLLGGRRD